MSGRKSRAKGASFERWVAKTLSNVYALAKRGIGQTRNGSEVADVEGTPWWVECKRHKRCNIQKAWEQANKDRDKRRPLVVTKDDYGDVLVTLDIYDFMALVEDGRERKE